MKPDVEIPFKVSAIEAKYILPNAVTAMHDALTSWDKAKIGQPVAIERRVDYHDQGVTLLPEYAVYSRSRKSLYQEVYQSFPVEQRRLLADAICMSSIGANFGLLHNKIKQAAGQTICNQNRFRMFYMRDALVFIPMIPFGYWKNRVSPYLDTDLAKQSQVPLGVIVVPPIDDKDDAQKRRQEAIQNAFDLYVSVWPDGFRSGDTFLMPSPPTEVISDL